MCSQPQTPWLRQRWTKITLWAFLQAPDKGHDHNSDVNLVSRREDKLEKKVFKINPIFQTLFRNVQIHYIMRERRKMLQMAKDSSAKHREVSNPFLVKRSTIRTKAHETQGAREAKHCSGDQTQIYGHSSWQWPSSPSFNTLTEKDIWKTMFLGCLSASFLYNQNHNFATGKKLHSDELCKNRANDPNCNLQRDTYLQ